MSDKSQKTRKKPGPVPRHGGYSYLTRGTLPEKRKYVGHYLTAIREGLIHDLAAREEDLSTAQRIMIDRTVTFIAVVRLIEEHARDNGILDSRGRLTSGLTGHYLSFNRQIKENLALLGIHKRKADSAIDLQDYIKTFDRKAARVEARARRKAANVSQETKAQDAVEITQPSASGEKNQDKGEDKHEEINSGKGD